MPDPFFGTPPPYDPDSDDLDGDDVPDKLEPGFRI